MLPWVLQGQDGSACLPVWPRVGIPIGVCRISISDLCFLPCLVYASLLLCPPIRGHLPCRSVSYLSLCLHFFRMDLPSSGPQDTTPRNPQPCECHSSPALEQLPSPLLPQRANACYLLLMEQTLLRLTSLPFSSPSPQGILLLQLCSHHNQTPAAEAERGQGSHRGLGKHWALGPGLAFRKPPPTLLPLLQVPELELGLMACLTSSCWSVSPALHSHGTPSSLGEAQKWF